MSDADHDERGASDHEDNGNELSGPLGPPLSSGHAGGIALDLAALLRRRREGTGPESSSDGTATEEDRSCDAQVRQALRLVTTPGRLLTKVSVSGVGLTSLGWLCGLPHLVYVNAMSNRITELPDGVARLQRLRCLLLADNRLTALNDELCRCAQLNTLVLNANALTELPRHFLCLRALRRLDICHNRLVDLPARLFHMPALRAVRLNDNRLCMLPGLPAQHRAEQRVVQGWDDNRYWEHADTYRAQSRYGGRLPRLWAYTMPQAVREAMFYFRPDEWRTLGWSAERRTTVDRSLLALGDPVSDADDTGPLPAQRSSMIAHTPAHHPAEENQEEGIAVELQAPTPTLLLLAAQALIRQHGLMQLRRLCGRGQLSSDVYGLVKERAFRCDLCTQWSVLPPLRLVRYECMRCSFKCRYFVPFWTPVCSERCARQHGTVYWRHSLG